MGFLAVFTGVITIANVIRRCGCFLLWEITVKQYKAILFLLPLLACSAAMPAHAKEYSVGKAPVIKEIANPAGEALVKEITKRAAPSATENVAILGPLMGTWYYRATVWTVPDDVKPYQSMGKITNEMIMDNRFLSGTGTGILTMGGDEMSVHSQELIGYDNAKKSFTSVWIGTLSTGMMIGSGTYDKKANAIEEAGTFTNPVNGAEEKFRSELKFVDAGHYSRTIFTTKKSGKESRLMEFEYSRTQ
jgi:hypothetical protein